VAHEFGRARNKEWARDKVERNAGGRESRRGEVFMVVRKAARPGRARLPRSGASKPTGADRISEITISIKLLTLKQVFCIYTKSSKYNCLKTFVCFRCFRGS
jgi:hypothetical protein